MPLWGNQDNAANSDIAAVMQMSKHVNSTNQSALFENVTPGNGPHNNPGVAYGQFGVDTNEVTVNPAIPHSGWVLRKEGTGLRAGRVTYEVLVATGTINTDGSDNTWFPEYKLAITTQPTSNTATTAKDLTFTVAGASTPSGATLTYKWQRNIASGVGGWIDAANTSGQYSNNTSPTFTANNLTANGNVFRVIVSTTGANSVTSGNATISLHP
jgi:hypothetical protein